MIGESSALERPYGAPKRFVRAFLWSFTGHVLFSLVLLLRVLLWSKGPLSVESAMRVDLVALPDKAPDLSVPSGAPPQEQVDPTRLPPPPAAVDETPKVNLHPKIENKPVASPKVIQKEQSAALRRLQAFDKLDKLKDDGTRVKGNLLSSGQSLRGIAKLNYDGYLEDIDSRIKKRWFLPRWLNTTGLKARIMVKISSEGRLIGEPKVVESSGQQAFDESAIKAIETSGPYPRPPASLAGILETQGAELIFVPGE